MTPSWLLILLLKEVSIFAAQRITSSWEAKWWDRQLAQKLWPQGSMATQSRSVLRQIWHWKSSSVLVSAVVYFEVAIRCSNARHCQCKTMTSSFAILEERSRHVM